MILWKIPKIYLLAHWLCDALMRCNGDQVVHWVCGALVSLSRWLTCALLRWSAWAAGSMRRGGSESLIYLYSSLTHTPTDSQIQFNRLFDDLLIGLHPPIHIFNLIDYLMNQHSPNNPITRQTLKQELLVICPNGNHHCITCVDWNNPQ